VLLCATNRYLKSEVEAGHFRTDLYYRINGLTLTLPALRDRSDFQILITQFVEEAAPGRGVSLESDVLEAFRDFNWPGNLRQLANAINTACALLSDDRVRIGFHDLSEDLSEELRKLPPKPNPFPTTENLRALSDSVIEHAVHSSGGNMSDAARRLGISRNTLYRRIKHSNLRLR